jgi:ankyrin repeat protein
MTDLEKLIDAAKRGHLADVKAIAQTQPDLINQRDELGATPLHHAAFAGHRDVVRALIEHGADLNAADGEFGATPAGWAIEYLRELGGFLSIELDDLAFAIRRRDLEWVARFLKRFPALRAAKDPQGKPFQQLAQESGNVEIKKLFA